MNGSYNSNSSTSAAQDYPASEKAFDPAIFPLKPAGDEEEAQEMREDALDEQQEEVPEEPWAPLSGRKLFSVSALFVFGYLAVGVVVYMMLAGMKFLDALYFCVGERACFFFLPFSSALFLFFLDTRRSVFDRA